ncbi:uncharacterized protein [Eurosta solidaginis]|uniref:uncharacterized protein n=1 Tax=Eurosta solidaginis TaxID=178769 RepID=UPI0035309898
MKVYIALLFFGVLSVASSAKVLQPAVNYEGTVESLIKEAETISLQTAKRFELQFKEIVLEPIDTVDSALQMIEDRREENSNCVEAKNSDVELVVDKLYENMNICVTTAAKESAAIMIDVNSAVQQLGFDGYKILRLYQKCKNYKNSILKSTCYTKLTIQTTLYIKYGRKSINTIKRVNSRIPPVFAEANICTHNSSREAVTKSNCINTEIDSCIKNTV